MFFQRTASEILVRLERGEPVIETLTNFVREQGIVSGQISGIGALTRVTLGYFDLDNREYTRKNFDGVYEVLSLLGNISLVDSNPFIHSHIVLGAPDFTTLGGHLFEAEVAVTLEIALRSFPKKIQRKFDPDLNLNLWDLGK